MIDQLQGTPISHHYAEINGVQLHYVEAGVGPLIVLLHGFPEFWYSWRAQIPALVNAGYRVAVPDQRGYNVSDKPPHVDDYRIEMLTADVAALIRACGEERAVVIGHDWGAMVAWFFAMRYPQMLDRLVIMNVPHPAHTISGSFNPRQMLRSWYVFFFQLPGLPEALFRANDFAMLRRIFRDDPLRRDAFSADDIERYVAAIAQPGALTGGMNYYRALVQRGLRTMFTLMRRIDTPTLVIWGEQDRYLGAELAAPNPQWVPHARVERLADASHWVQLDQPERVNALLLAFLGEHSTV